MQEARRNILSYIGIKKEDPPWYAYLPSGGLGVVGTVRYIITQTDASSEDFFYRVIRSKIISL
jgi:hypothetical protein